jgi:hypothetical protein
MAMVFVTETPDIGVTTVSIDPGPGPGTAEPADPRVVDWTTSPVTTPSAEMVNGVVFTYCTPVVELANTA